MKHDLQQYAGRYYQEKVGGKKLSGGDLFDFILENVENKIPKHKGGKPRKK